MAAVQVQKKSKASTASATSHNIVLDASPTQGNLLIVCAVADDYINTPSGWSLAASANDWTGTSLFYKIAGSGESATITVTIPSSTSMDLAAFEYSGMAASSPLDRTATAVAQSDPVSTGTTTTTAQANELLVALVGLSRTTAVIASWSNSFVQEYDLESTGSSINVELGVALRTVAATGTYSSAADLTSYQNDHSSGLIATFKIAAGGGAEYFSGIRLGMNRCTSRGMPTQRP